VSRFDKYEGMGGGFRAPLNAAVPSTDVGKIIGVSLNGSGKVVYGGATAAAVKGVICPVRAMNAGDPIDVMTDGEIVDCTLNDGTTALTAGTDYFATATAGTGGITATATSNQYIGHTVEATRLVVRVAR
jgi:hypothetical protein